MANVVNFTETMGRLSYWADQAAHEIRPFVELPIDVFISRTTIQTGSTEQVFSTN